MATGRKNRDIYLLRFIAVSSDGYKLLTPILNNSDFVSSVSSVKYSPANVLKISVAILNLVSFSLLDQRDSNKPEKINISLLSGCCL